MFHLQFRFVHSLSPWGVSSWPAVVCGEGCPWALGWRCHLSGGMRFWLCSASPSATPPELLALYASQCLDVSSSALRWPLWGSLTVLGPLHFHGNLRISSSTASAAGVLTGTAFNPHSAWGGSALWGLWNLPAHDPGILPPFTAFFSFSQWRVVLLSSFIRWIPVVMEWMHFFYSLLLINVNAAEFLNSNFVSSLPAMLTVALSGLLVGSRCVLGTRGCCVSLSSAAPWTCFPCPTARAGASSATGPFSHFHGKLDVHYLL